MKASGPSVRIALGTNERIICRNAPVRRETRMERKHRQLDQIPPTRHLYHRLRHAKIVDYVTVNRDLVPGEAKYIKDITLPSKFAVKPHSC